MTLDEILRSYEIRQSYSNGIENQIQDLENLVLNLIKYIKEKEEKNP